MNRLERIREGIKLAQKEDVSLETVTKLAIVFDVLLQQIKTLQLKFFES